MGFSSRQTCREFTQILLHLALILLVSYPALAVQAEIPQEKIDATMDSYLQGEVGPEETLQQLLESGDEFRMVAYWATRRVLQRGDISATIRYKKLELLKESIESYITPRRNLFNTRKVTLVGAVIGALVGAISGTAVDVNFDLWSVAVEFSSNVEGKVLVSAIIGAALGYFPVEVLNNWDSRRDYLDDAANYFKNTCKELLIFKNDPLLEFSSVDFSSRTVN